jgi:hypothetical protein
MKKIKSITRHVSGDPSQTEPILRTLELRDPAGNLIEETYYFADGSIEQRILRKFDDESRLLEEQQFSSGEAPDQVTTYTLNEKGKPFTKSVQYKNGGQSITTYAYQVEDNSVTMEVRDQDGVFEEKIYQRMDQEGKVLEEIRHGEGEEIEQQQFLSYDDNGRQISRKIEATGEKVVQQFFDYFFDDDGKLIEVEMYDENDQVLQAHNIEYNKAGERSRYLLDDLIQDSQLEETWEYDDQQRIIKNTKSRGGGSVLESTEYNFGDHGYIHTMTVSRPTGEEIDTFTYEFYDEQAASS